MSQLKPTILIVPGSWHVPEHFQPFVNELESRGFPSLTINLPTCNVSTANVLDLGHADLAGSKPIKPWPDMYADAQDVRTAILELVQVGKLVLIVAHSYGGLPASEALHSDLTWRERDARGERGGVIGFMALALFLLPVKMTTLEAVGGKPLAATPEQPSGLHIIKDPGQFLFNDLPVHKREHWIGLLRPQPWAVHETPLTNAGYLHVPCAYMKTKADQLVSLASQEQAIAAAKKRGGLDIVEYMVDGGHDAFILSAKYCSEKVVEFAEMCLHHGL